MINKKILFGILPVTILLSACNATGDKEYDKKPFDFLKNINLSREASETKDVADEELKDKSIGEILSGVEPSINTKNGFAKSIAQAVLSDPSIIAAKGELAA